jgi:hypothetical protein
LGSPFAEKHTLWIDLLNGSEEMLFTRRPQELEARVKGAMNLETRELHWVVIDEVQKVPALLNEVHRLLELPALKNKLQFTPSSAFLKQQHNPTDKFSTTLKSPETQELTQKL